MNLLEMVEPRCNLAINWVEQFLWVPINTQHDTRAFLTLKFQRIKTLKFSHLSKMDIKVSVFGGYFRLPCNNPLYDGMNQTKTVNR